MPDLVKSKLSQANLNRMRPEELYRYIESVQDDKAAEQLRQNPIFKSLFKKETGNML